MRNTMILTKCTFRALLLTTAAILLCHCADTIPTQHETDLNTSGPVYSVQFEDGGPLEDPPHAAQLNEIVDPAYGDLADLIDHEPQEPFEPDVDNPQGGDVVDDDPENRPEDAEGGAEDGPDDLRPEDEPDRSPITPAVTSISVQTNEDTELTFVLTTEQPIPSSFRYEITRAPSHGVLTGDLPTVSYLPAGDYSGADEFEFVVTNGEQRSAPGAVTIDVVEGSILYVSTIGDDTNSGTTPESPLLSIGTAVAAVDEDGNDTVIIEDGVFNESIVIRRDVALVGDGPEQTFITGSFSHRPVEIVRGVTVTMTDIAIVDGEAGEVNGGGILNWGNLRLDNVAVMGNHAGHSGGGIATYGNLEADGLAVSRNTASLYGGGLYNYGTMTLANSNFERNEVTLANGGGLHNDGVASIKDSIFIGNYGLGDLSQGGGLSSAAGSISIVACLFDGNNVGGSGGGIRSSNSEVSLDNVRITGNTALSGRGGGIYVVSDSELTITNTELSFNNAGSDGGGIYSAYAWIDIDSSAIHDNSAQVGGGADIRLGSTFITNTTISNNQADHIGGLSVAGESVEMSNVTIAFNEAFESTGGVEVDADALIFVNNIVASNTPNDCSERRFESSGFNIAGDDSCAFDGPGDINKVDAGLASLEDNGGPTLSHRLIGTSPAIDSADPFFCSDFDQRGMPRGSDRCDIGAIEIQD